MITKLKALENCSLEAGKEAVEDFDNLSLEVFQQKYNLVETYVDVNAAIEMLREKLKGNNSLETKVGPSTTTKKEDDIQVTPVNDHWSARAKEALEEEEGDTAVEVEEVVEQKDFYRNWCDLE